MKFKDTYINTNECFTIGKEESTGKYYISIPVSNRLVDYDEYYEIEKTTYDICISNEKSALDFVKRCRSRQEDQRLFFKPGADRGTPR